jgi:hypothetical protein
MYLYSIGNNNKICYVNNCSELILSDLNGNDRNVLNYDTNFVDSIIEILLTNDYIVLRMITDDIYYYNIAEDKLVFLGNYYVVKIICLKKTIYQHFVCHILVVSDTKIILFKNFIKVDELVLPDPILHCFNIGCDDKYYACVSSDKTLILQNEIKMLVTLKQPYKSIIRNDNHYYCLLYNGHIDVYNTKWILIHTIIFERIISIDDHNNLILVDSNRNCYQIFFGELSEQGFVRIDINIPIEKLIYSDNNFNIFLVSKQNYLLTLSDSNRSYIIFDDYIIFSSAYQHSTHGCNFNFNNDKFFKMYGPCSFMSIDDAGIVQQNDINTHTNVNIASSTCNYIIKKLTKIVNTKPARFVSPLIADI